MNTSLTNKENESEHFFYMQKVENNLLEPIVPPRAGFLMNWASVSKQLSQLNCAEVQNEDNIYDELGSESVPRGVMEAIEASLACAAPEDSLQRPPLHLAAQSYYSLSEEHQSSYNITTNPSNIASFTSTELQSKFESYRMDYNSIAERIWRFNDQDASLFLQERLRHAVPEEFERIVAIINLHLDSLMVHRFGNFLVQCMLELALPEQVAQFSSHLTGKVSKLSRHQFCCHVIQKLLDIGPLVVQARVAAELLDDAIATMSSPFGTHVWQKLLHLPWSPDLPAVTLLANNAVHLEAKKDGWMAVAQTEGGCATIKSYLSVPKVDAGRQECINELLNNISGLIKQPYCSFLICKLMVMSSTRARTMTLLFSKAYEYCKHPVASLTLIHLLKLKIPSLPARLGAAIAPYHSELSRDSHGIAVLASLKQAQGG